MARRLAVTGTLLFALFGMARPSDAGIIDIIWEMSGPQLIGAGYGCSWTLRLTTHECRVGTVGLNRMARVPTLSAENVFITGGASLYGSTGKDSETQGYDPGEIWMVALEPGLAYRGKKFQRFLWGAQVWHGAGASFNVLFGRDIRWFNKFAFTVTPVDLAWTHVAVGVKFRLYPNGFTDDEFKPGPLIDRNRPFEAVLGFSVSYIIKNP